MRARSRFTGDGGLAASARLDSVTTIEFDPAGNLCAVRRLELPAAPNRFRDRRIITTIAGSGTCATGTEGDGGPATAASIGSYTGFAFDPSGSIYLWPIRITLRRIEATTGHHSDPSAADSARVESRGRKLSVPVGAGVRCPGESVSGGSVRARDLPHFRAALTTSRRADRYVQRRFVAANVRVPNAFTRIRIP